MRKLAKLMALVGAAAGTTAALAQDATTDPLTDILNAGLPAIAVAAVAFWLLLRFFFGGFGWSGGD